MQPRNPNGRWSCFCALLLLCLTFPLSTLSAKQLQTAEDLDGVFPARWRRDLEALGQEDEEFCDHENCSKICFHPPPEYNDTCDFVKGECDSKYELFDYLRFAYCDLGSAGKVIGSIFLAIWLCYLLLLLSTTVDNFFVPVLQLMSNKLRLPSSIAGMTLLALGNGAPDIFVAFSALQDDDLPLMLGALLGAGLFITSVVLGIVMLVAPSRSYNINPVDFMRDLFAYIVVLAIIVAVAYDGKVTLAEGICFPLLYLIYVAVVVSLSYFMNWYKKNKEKKKEKTNAVFFDKDRDDVTIEEEGSNSMPSTPETPRANASLTKDAVKSDSENEKVKSVILPLYQTPKKVQLVGLTPPQGKVKKVIYILDFPFSVLRWLTIPPCSPDGEWSIFHYAFAVISPLPMSMFLLLVATGGWSGFSRTVGNSSFPLPILLLFCASPFCVLLIIFLRYNRQPHWVMQIFLMIGAFIMSVAWLNVIANEVVSVLQALGLLAGISTAILGLTVLAIGNSVADLVADALVASKGKPEMAMASCFGAPLITHVLGLSFALLPKIFGNNAKPYEVGIGDIGFVHVKLAWIFLGIILLGSAVVFPLFKFKPPKEYSLVLVYVYTVFMIFSVLVEAGKLNITLT